MLFNSTLLAEFVKDFGDSILISFVSGLYKSPMAILIVYLATIFMFLATAYSISTRKLHAYFKIFWIVWPMALPIQGKPLIYLLVNSASTTLTNDLQKLTYKLFTEAGTKKTLPPGFVFNTLVRASMTKVTDPSIQNDVLFILENCIPYGNNKDGIPISSADLFSGKIDETGGVDRFIYNFDPVLLSNRKYIHKGFETSCLSLLNSTLSRLRSHIRGKNLTNMPPTLYVGSNNGEGDEHDQVTTWDHEGSYESNLINKIAVNLAQANAIQSLTLKHYFDVDINYEGKGTNEAINPSIEVIKSLSGSGFNPHKIALNILNTPKAIGRYFNVDGFYDTADGLYQINEKLNNLPYYIAFIQTLLKISIPVIVLVGFFGTLRWITAWSVAWFLTLIAPSILYILRLTTNSILLHVKKIGEGIPITSSEPAFLQYGVDFDAAVRMLEDSSRAMSVFIQCEAALWGFLFMAIPAAAWFATGKVGSVAGKVASTVGGAAGYGLGMKLVTGKGSSSQNAISPLQSTQNSSSSSSYEIGKATQSAFSNLQNKTPNFSEFFKGKGGPKE